MSTDDSRKPFDRAAHCRAIGSKGGTKTVERHGAEHMREIGRKGFAAAAANYPGGTQGLLYHLWQEGALICPGEGGDR